MHDKLHYNMHKMHDNMHDNRHDNAHDNMHDNMHDNVHDNVPMYSNKASLLAEQERVPKHRMLNQIYTGKFQGRSRIYNIVVIAR